jgi:D-serine deaminase-like pyridoxal phosphate-dependent protein
LTDLHALNAKSEFERLLADPVDWRYKGFPPDAAGVTIATVPAQRWNILSSGFMPPVLVLKGCALRHNLHLMARYCDQNGVVLAPHGKTHMAPQLARLQLDAGAWGISAATISQAEVFRRFGVGRILLANEVVDRPSVDGLAKLLAASPALDLYCLVDSGDSVQRMAERLSGASRPLRVLVELGRPGGRTGCRSIQHAREVAALISGVRALELAGVGGYEGIIGSDRTASTLGQVDQYVDGIRTLAEELAAEGAFEHVEEVLLSVGGSAYFDRVIERLRPPVAISKPVKVVLRSGSYLTHDSGVYEEVSPFGAHSEGSERFRPALEIWGSVLSRPQRGLAILGFGRRDVPHDAGLPVPRFAASDGHLRPLGGAITNLDDQHAYLEVEDGQIIAVGDLVGCGISHPCTAFDKWRLIPVVDDDYNVTDAIRTFF